MARLIEIERCDEDTDTIFYRFGPARDTMIATAGISKYTGEAVLLAVDEDGALRSLNIHGCHLLGVAIRRAWGNGSLPASFTYRNNSGGTGRVDLLQVTENELFVQVHNSNGEIATAAIDRQSGEPRFIALENCQQLSQSMAASMFPLVRWKLLQHFANGEFPANTQFMS